MFDPLGYLDLAHELASGNEASMRTSVNRAYYALFLRGRDALAAAQLITPRGDGTDHGRVIAALRQNKRVTAGNKLDKLRELRWKADYSTSAAMSQPDVKQAFRLADDIKSSLAPDWGIAS